MFTSVRYYFRKKVETEKKQRCKYVSLNRDFLATIDKYLFNMIQTSLNEKTMVSETIPSYAFELFCEQYIHEIDQIECSDDKLKKTFKNRYYMMKRDLMKQ